MQCSKAIERLSSYVDGVLDEGTLELVEAHLRECPNCRQELAALRTLVQTAAAVQPHEPPTNLKSRIMHAVRTDQAIEECRAPVVGLLSSYVGFVEPPADLRARILAATSHRKSVLAGFPEWLRGLAANRAAQWTAGAAVAGAIAVAVMVQPPYPARQAPRAMVASERPAAVTTSVSPAATDRPAQGVARPEPRVTAHVPASYNSHARGKRQIARAPGAKPGAIRMAMRKPPSSPSVNPSAAETDSNVDAANARETMPVEVAAAPAPAPEIAPEPKRHDTPALVRVAAAPPVKSEDSGQWIKRAKAEVAMRRSAQGSGGIRLFETRF